MLMCTLSEGGGGQKKYVLYTCENIDNYGWPLYLMKVIDEWFLIVASPCINWPIQWNVKVILMIWSSQRQLLRCGGRMK